MLTAACSGRADQNRYYCILFGSKSQVYAFYQLKCHRCGIVLSSNVTEGTMPTKETMTINERLKYLGRFTEPPVRGAHHETALRAG
jgi:hypothetical protein